MILTKKQIEQIKKIIRNYYHIFVFKNLGSQYLSEDELKDLPENLTTTDYFKDVFILGKTQGTTPAEDPDKTYEDFRARIFNRNMGLTPTDERALEILKDSIAHYIHNLKNRTVNHILGTIHDKNKEAHLENLGEVVRGTVEQAITEGRQIQELSAELRDKTGDVARDWQKFVRTELGNAINHGSAHAITERNIESGIEKEDILVYKQGPDDAATCLKIGSKILTKKGYKKVEDLTFEDYVTNINNIHNSRGGKINYSKVEYKKIIERDCLEVELDDGSIISCSEDHPLLIKYKNRYWFWEVGKLNLNLDIEVPNILKCSQKELSKISSDIKKSKVFRKNNDCEDIWDFIQKSRKSIIKEYVEKESPIYKIAKKYKLPRRTGRIFIRSILELSGVKIEKSKHLKNNYFNKRYIEKLSQEKRSLLEDNKENILFLYNEGFGISSKDLAKKYNVGYRLMSNFLKKNGLEVFKLGKHKGGIASWKNISEEEYQKRCERSRQTFLNTKTKGSKAQQEVFKLTQQLDPEAEYEKRISDMKVDIYSPKYNIVVEYDGGGHWIQSYIGNTTISKIKQNDYARDKILRGKGFKVLRIDSKKDLIPDLRALEKELDNLFKSQKQFKRIVL